MILQISSHIIFFFNDTATTEIYTLSLHDALPISLPTWRNPNFTSYSSRSPVAKGTRAGTGGSGAAVAAPACTTTCARSACGSGKTAAISAATRARAYQSTPRVRRRPRWKRSASTRASKSEKVDSIGPGMDATLARAEIVTWLNVDRLDAPSERCRTHEKVDVRGPHRSLDDRLVTRVTNEIAQQRYAIQTKSAERIGHPRYRHIRSERPRSEASQPTHWARRRRGVLGGNGSFGHDEIRPALEAFDQLGQMFRLV